MKIINKLLIAGAATIGGVLLGRFLAKTEEEKKNFSFIGGALGFLLGGAIVSNLEKDTVNYTLLHNGKRVYEGITFKNRLSKRLIEHECDGKIFNDFKTTIPRIRSEASALEVKRIKQHLPKYNIQHNC